MSRISPPALLLFALLVLAAPFYMTGQWAASLGEAQNSSVLAMSIGLVVAMIMGILLLPIVRRMLADGYGKERSEKRIRSTIIALVGLGLMPWVAPLLGGSDDYIWKFFSGVYAGVGLHVLLHAYLMGKSKQNERPS